MFYEDVICQLTLLTTKNVAPSSKGDELLNETAL